MLPTLLNIFSLKSKGLEYLMFVSAIHCCLMIFVCLFIILCGPKSIKNNKILRPKLANVFHHQSVFNLSYFLATSHILSQYINIYSNGKNRMLYFVVFLV